MKGLVETAPISIEQVFLEVVQCIELNKNMQVSAILQEVLDDAVSGAAGQYRSENVSPSTHIQNTLCQLGRSTTEQEPGNSYPIESCRTENGLPDPSVSSQDTPTFKPTKVPRKELDWQPKEELSDRSPINSDLCHPSSSSEQEQVQSNYLPNSGQEVSHPSPCSQDFLFFKAIEKSKRSFDLQAGEEEEEELKELSPPSYLINSPNTSKLGSLGGSPERKHGESPRLSNSSQDVLFLSFKSIESEMMNRPTEKDELTPPSLQNSPTTSELCRLQR